MFREPRVVLVKWISKIAGTLLLLEARILTAETVYEEITIIHKIPSETASKHAERESAQYNAISKSHTPPAWTPKVSAAK